MFGGRISRVLGGGALAVIGCCASLGADTYKVDAVHSTAIFRIKHLNVSYAYGRFNELSGTFTLDAEKPENTTFDIEIKVDSIDTADKKRDEHLKKDEFFDSAKFPTMRFKSKSVKKAGDALDVTGDLTLHGVTKPITVKVERTGEGSDPWGGVRSGFETTFTIKRSDFGMGGMTAALGEDVRLIVSVEGVRP